MASQETQFGKSYMGILDRLLKSKSSSEETQEEKDYLFKGGKLAGAQSKTSNEHHITQNMGEVDLKEVGSNITYQKLKHKEGLTAEEVGSNIPDQTEAPKIEIKTIPGSVKVVNKKLMEGWEQWLRTERNRAGRTVTEYVSDLRAFLGFLITKRGASLKSGTVEDVREFVRILRNRGCGPTGVNRRLSALKMFYAWALREQYVKLNPASSEFVGRQKIPARLPIHLIDPEHEDFMKALEKYKTRERAFIALMNLGGLRISEACSVRIENLVRDSEGIVAVRVIGKGNKERLIPIHTTLAEYIEQWLKERKGPKSGYLFDSRGGHIHRITGWMWYKDFGSRVGLNSKITPHKLRHTFATRLYRKGVPIFDLQNLLGHEDPRTTAIYAHVDYEALRSHVQKLL